MPVLETDRLILSELKPEDGQFILGLLNDPDFLMHIGDKGVQNLDDAVHYIETGPRVNYADHGHGLYKVSLKDGTPIGICGLLYRDNLDDPDIGFATLPEFRKNGYTLEAAKAAIKDGFDRFNYNRIVGITSKENVASIRLLGKLGLFYEKMVQIDPNGKPIQLYAIHFS